MKKKIAMLSVGGLSLLVAGCATETSRSIEVKPVHNYAAYTGVLVPISIGKFDNLSDFQRGIFSDGVDRLGNQAKTILIAQLKQTNHFNVLDRANLQEIKQEEGFKGNTALNIKAASYLVTGDITEFGRKEIGDKELFGILGRAKKQIAYAKATINIVKVDSSEVVCSTQGAAEYQLSNRQIIGFGGSASYDSTLNGKVLDLAINNAVNKLITNIQQAKCVLN